MADKYPTRTAAPGIPSHCPFSASTGTRRCHIQVISVNQNVRTARARIPYSEDDLTGQLMFDVYVELLNAPQLEIGILGQKGSREIRRDWRRGDSQKSLGQTYSCRRLAKNSGACSG